MVLSHFCVSSVIMSSSFKCIDRHKYSRLLFAMNTGSSRYMKLFGFTPTAVVPCVSFIYISVSSYCVCFKLTHHPFFSITYIHWFHGVYSKMYNLDNSQNFNMGDKIVKNSNH